MYDFIGDVHGRYKELESLLVLAGYKKDSNGIYFHPQRKAFFLGDFIDKGPQVLKTYRMIKSMIENNYAKAVLGNHELNFIALHTYNKEKALRERSLKNLKQISKSKKLIDKKSEVIKFLLTIPVFYEEDNFRAIHACWSEEDITSIKKYLNGSFLSINKMKEIYLDDKSKIFNSLEILLKGKEVNIYPESYIDKNGSRRYKSRINWWEDSSIFETLPDNTKINGENLKIEKYNKKKKVFFGHYTKKGHPYKQSDYALCLDFCKNGFLAMYRDDLNKKIHEKNIIYVKNNPSI